MRGGNETAPAAHVRPLAAGRSASRPDRSRRPLIALLLCVVATMLGAGFAVARAETPKDGPEFYLDLDTGGHRAFVKDLAFTPDGATLVSASDDKTIRIWDWRQQVSIRTIRGQIGEGNEGKIFAVAVSPDGETIAAGGYFGKGLGDKPPYGDIRLFDLGTGKLEARLKGPQYAVYDVAFSPDGSRLAAAGQDGFVFIWRKGEDGAWIAETTLDGDSWHIQGIAWTAGGARLAAVTTDNGIRLWDAGSGAEVAMADAEELRDVRVMALAASQDGSRFAIGTESGEVQVRDGATGALIRAIAGLDFYVGSLVFADGGRLIAASCGYRCADRNRTVVFDVDTGGRTAEYRGHDGTVFAGAADRDGLHVATAGGTHHAIHVWNPRTGERLAEMVGAGRPVTAVGIDEAGSEVAWGTANPCPDRVACPEVQGALETMLLLPRPDRFFERPAPAGAGPYSRAVHAEGDWSVSAVAGGPDGLENAVLEIANGGKLVQSIENDATNGYLHAAFTLLSGGLDVVTGGNDGTLIQYSTATGDIAGEFRDGHTGEINAIATAAGRRLMVTGSADQTLRLWNLETRELIVSMFFAGNEFVIWMPQGYYYSSDEGDKMIGWHVNQGPDKEARFVRAGQLKRYLWSPEMVRRAIILGSAKKAVAEMRPGVDDELLRLLQRRPPEFDIRLVDDQSGVREGFVAVEIVGAEESGTDVAEFAILSNSRNVSTSASRSVSGDGRRTVIEVPVDDGENRISITGVNEFGYLTERSVVALAKPRKEEKRKGKLYLIAVGVEKYPLLPTDCNGRSCDLRYPVDDAAELVRVIAERSAPLYAGMETLVLVNRDALDETPDRQQALGRVVALDAILEPDSDTIGDEIEDFLDKPGPDDTTIVFVAGHGINVDEDYYFIPSDGRKQDADRWKRSSLVDWSDIQKAVERAEGVRFMLLDTCHAANSFNPRLEKDAADARIVVFSATAANSTAAELPELGHGVFTYSVLQGLLGAANSSGDGIRLLGLADYIYREVIRLTGSKQKPFYFISNMENILLARP